MREEKNNLDSLFSYYGKVNSNKNPSEISSSYYENEEEMHFHNDHKIESNSSAKKIKYIQMK